VPVLCVRVLRRFPPPWTVEDFRRLLRRDRQQRAKALERLLRRGAGAEISGKVAHER
jgi:hypothetical protein